MIGLIDIIEFIKKNRKVGKNISTTCLMNN